MNEVFNDFRSQRKPYKDQSNIKYKQNKIKTIKTNDKQKFKKLTGETTLEITSGSVWGWHAPCELPRTSRPMPCFHWAGVFITNLCY